MKYLVLFLICFQAHAGPKLTELYIEAEKAVMTNRTFNQVEGEKVGGWLGLGYKVEYGFIYSKNKLTSEYSDKQFRHIALDSELGFNITKQYQVYIRHYSGHMMDYAYDTKFPEENAIGIRLNLIGDTIE